MGKAEIAKLQAEYARLPLADQIELMHEVGSEYALSQEDVEDSPAEFRAGRQG